MNGLDWGRVACQRNQDQIALLITMAASKADLKTTAQHSTKNAENSCLVDLSRLGSEEWSILQNK